MIRALVVNGKTVFSFYRSVIDSAAADLATASCSLLPKSGNSALGQYGFSKSPSRYFNLNTLRTASSIRSVETSPSSTSSFKAGQKARLYGSITDRKSTRLNSSHVRISYADLCFNKQ